MVVTLAATQYYQGVIVNSFLACFIAVFWHVCYQIIVLVRAKHCNNGHLWIVLPLFYSLNFNHAFWWKSNRPYPYSCFTMGMIYWLCCSPSLNKMYYNSEFFNWNRNFSTYSCAVNDKQCDINIIYCIFEII